MSRKLRALDLYCRAGGVSVGLARAGFEVVGVDLLDMRGRHRGGEFAQADALLVLDQLARAQRGAVAPLFDVPPFRGGFDFIWASPPCQAHTVLRSLNKGKEYPDLIPATRERLKGCGIPWVIENVPGAPLQGDLLVLCGTMFGLQTLDGSAEIRRHRHFESSFPIAPPGPCRHGGGSLGVTGTGVDAPGRWGRRALSVVGGGGKAMSGGMAEPQGMRKRRAVSVTGSTPQTNVVHNQVRKTYSVEDARAAMGIDWMSMRDLSQAIPPCYSEWIGRAAIAFITEGRCPGVQMSLFSGM